MDRIQDRRAKCLGNKAEVIGQSQRLRQRASSQLWQFEPTRPARSDTA